MSVAPRTRRDAILEAIRVRGHAAVKDLAAALEVSEATVRRDLRALADSRLIDLVYGGATIRRFVEESVASRSNQNAAAKRVIGRLAAGLVADGDMIYVDSGSTCFEMCTELKRRSNLTVIVNSTRLALELGSNPEITLIQIGGHYRPERMDFVGPLAANAIDQLRGYTAFLGADGLSLEFGISATDIHTAYLYQHVIKNARDAVLLVDHTKFQAPSLFRIADLEAVSRIVTDLPPDPAWREALAARGIDLVCPETNLREDYAQERAHPS